MSEWMNFARMDEWQRYSDYGDEMGRTSTHSYALLKLSEEAYEEIRQKLIEAGYSDQFHPNREAPASPIIDMHGIAVVPEVEMTPDTPDKDLER